MALTARVLSCLAAGLWLAQASAQDRASPFLESQEVEQIELYLHPADWSRLKENYLENEYYPAVFVWRSYLIENIGVRSRGRGSRNSLKPGLRIDFNRYEPNEFLGLSGLALVNLAQDPPMLRDYLSMWLFRQSGAPAPRQVYAKVSVNGEPMGLYLVAEEVAKPFLFKHFNEVDGSLFEYDWVDEWHWERRGDRPENYSPAPFKPKTHELAPDIPALIRLVDAFNQDEIVSAADFETILDLDNWLRHLAVEWYLAETDGFLGDVGTNNFYLYRVKRDGLWRLIAWDKNATLAWYECPPGWRVNSSAVTRRLFADPRVRARFVEILREVAGSGEMLESVAADVWERIRDAALGDSKKPYSNEVLEQSVADTLFFLKVRREAAAQALDEAAWRSQ
jgi:hypothetical protein